MALAVLEEHEELAHTVRAFLVKHNALAAARAALDGASPTPEFWPAMADLGWLGLHVPAEDGGSGFGVLELAIVANELGRACCPGPFVTNAVAAGAIAAHGDAEQRKALLPDLLSGRAIAGLALKGSGGPALYGALADLLLVADGADLVVVDRAAANVTVDERANLDPTRPSAVVQVDTAGVPDGRRLSGAAASARRLFAVLAAAEAAGGSGACREMATEYAKVRTAFGRPIGQYQAIKHHCANMLVEEEVATAAAWQAAAAEDAAESVADLAALTVCLPAFLKCAKLNIQVHGGIGFTWEHDAHLFLRRASVLNTLAGPFDERAAELGARHRVDAGDGPVIQLPPEAEEFRAQVRAFRADYEAAAGDARHQLAVDNGYLFPHLPAPVGRNAGPVEQLVIEQELAGLNLHEPLGPTGWMLPIAMPTILAHANEAQKERWLRPSIEGRLRWCQLFSEPGAGSDLAALTTKAVRGDGGWIVTGQKVWTSSAHQADVGWALVRTDPEAAKHRGITAMVIDLKAPGVEVRPLKQISGHTEFNEVFLDEVFVPDDDVVGEVNGGWRVGLATLGNERVSIGDGGWGQAENLRFVEQFVQTHGADNPTQLRRLGEFLATAIALRAINMRSALRAIGGGAAGHEGIVTKLVSSEHAQQIAEFAAALVGDDALFLDGEHQERVVMFLFCRSMTIAGGTSEIGRNMIAERVLGLPRDPMP